MGLDLLFSSPLVKADGYEDVLETMKTARDMMTLTRKKAMDYFKHQAGEASMTSLGVMCSITIAGSVISK